MLTINSSSNISITGERWSRSRSSSAIGVEHIEAANHGMTLHITTALQPCSLAAFVAKFVHIPRMIVTNAIDCLSIQFEFVPWRSNRKVLTTMSSWTLCDTCKEDYSKRPGPRFAICTECQETRATSLAPILMDRAFRAHLARRVLGAPCPTRCAEHPMEHATFYESSLGDDEIYEDFIKFASEQFKRPQDKRSVTAFEVLVGHHEVQYLKYCSDCVAKAQTNLDRNELTQLCESCMGRRDNHIRITFQSHKDFHEPWERLDFQVIGSREATEGQETLGYDDLIEKHVYGESRFGSTATVTAILGLIIVTILGASNVSQAIYYNYKTKEHNAAMLAETRQSNAWNEQMALANYSATKAHNDRMCQATIDSNRATEAHNDRTYEATVAGNDQALKKVEKEMGQIWVKMLELSQQVVALQSSIKQQTASQEKPEEILRSLEELSTELQEKQAAAEDIGPVPEQTEENEQLQTVIEDVVKTAVETCLRNNSEEEVEQAIRKGISQLQLRRAYTEQCQSSKGTDYGETTEAPQ